MRYRLALYSVLCILPSFATGQFARDIGVDTVLNVDSLVDPVSGWMMVFPVFRNYGTQPVDSFEYGWRMDSSGVVVEHESLMFDRPLPPEDTAGKWVFTDWPNYNRYVYCYIDMFVYTKLAGDEDRSNDTCYLRFWFSTAQLGGSFLVHDYCHVSEVDGVINREEYSWHNDISDFAGRAGNRRPRTSVFVFHGYGERCWFGVDVRGLGNRQDGDRVLCYADVDGDRQWEADSSEGLYAVEVRNGIDSTFFTPMPGGAPRPCTLMVAASSARSGNLQFEIGYPFNGNPWWVSLGAVSVWRGDSCWGWWPQSLDTADVADPSQYGVFDWVTMALEEDRPSGERATDESRSSSIARGVLFISAGPMARHPIPAVLLDATGRKVLDLKPGPNDVSRLSPGVYFVRELSAVGGKPSAVSVRKVVLQR